MTLGFGACSDIITSSDLYEKMHGSKSPYESSVKKFDSLDFQDGCIQARFFQDKGTLIFRTGIHNNAYEKTRNKVNLSE